MRATPDLPPPRNLNAALVDGAVALTWDAAATDAASITGYRILRRRPDVDAEVDFDPIAATGATETRYVDAGVEAGHRYAYQVKTQRDNYLSGSSNVASIDVPAPPPPPGNLLAREDDGMVTLTWTDPEDDAITGYQVRYEESATDLSDWSHDHDIDSDANTTTHPVTGLTNGIEYTFEVRAMRGSVQGLPASVRATPGNRAPANLEAAVDNGAVALTWEAPTADVASVSSYHFHYSLSSDGVNVMRHGTFGTPDADTRTVDTIARERGYPYIAYKVRAKRGEEFSDWSNTVTVMFHDGPPPPEGLTASAGVGQVRLEWDDPENDAITGYQVRHGQRDAALPAWSDRHNITSTARTTTHTVTGLTDGTAYTFQVRAKKGDDDGAAAGVTQPAAPRNLSVDAGDASATLSWANPQDGAVIGYQVRFAEAGAALSAWRDIAGSDAAATTHAVTGLTHTTAYTFQVRATAADADGAFAGVTQPAQPGTLTASVGDGTVTLAWTDPGNVQITGYQYRYRVGDGAFGDWTLFPAGAVSNNSGTVPRLTNGDRHTFEVRAKAGNVDGAAASLTTIPGPPAAPASLSAAAGNRAVTLTWADPDNDTIDGYQVRYGRSSVDLPDWSDDHNIEGSGPATTRHRVTGLTNGREYTFDVRAYNEAGVGVSDSARATPEVPPCPRLIIDAISDVTVNVGGSVSLQANARGGCGSTRYSISGAPRNVNINETTGAISGRVPNSPATHNVTVTARDRAGNTDTEKFDIIVDCPSISVSQSPSPFEVEAGETKTLTANASGGCGSHTFSMSGQPEWVTPKEGSANQYNVAPPGDTAPGTYTFEVTATDGCDCTGKGVVTIEVIPPSDCDPIVIDPISNKTVAVNTRITITPRVQVNCQIIYTMSGRLPPGVTFDGGTGVISGTVGGSPDTYDVTVTATDRDNRNNTDDEDFRITVCEPVVIADIPPITVTAEARFSHTATVSGGCGTRTSSREDGPTWVGTEIDTNGNLKISGTAPSESGTYDVRVQVQDAYGNADFKSFSIVVTPCDIDVGGLPDSPVTETVCEAINPIQATASRCPPPYTFSIDGAPSGVTIIESGEEAGRISGIPTETGTFTVEVTARAGNRGAGNSRFTLKVICSAISVGGLSDVVVTRGQAMPPRTATASGGCGDVSYSIKDQPSGIGIETITENGVRVGRITGTPTEAGNFIAKVIARDGAACTGEGSLSITVCEPVVIADIPPITVTAEARFSHTATVSGGCGTRTSSREDGPTWVGTEIDTNGNLRIHGTAPSTPGRHDVRVQVQDAYGNADFKSFPIVVTPCDIDVGGLPDSPVTETVCEAINPIQATASGCPPPYTFSIDRAPSGVTIIESGEEAGHISGIPTETGTFTVEVTARAGNRGAGNSRFTLKVICSAISVGGLSDVVVTRGQAMPTRTATASGGCGDVTYSIEDQPSGIGIDGSTGEITGTPTEAGEFTAKVKATDGAACTGEGSLPITVCEPVVLQSISNETVVVDDNFSITATATGGCGSIQFSRLVGPGWVNIDEYTGVISGTAPPPPNRHMVTVKATDTAHTENAASVTFDIIVVDPPCADVVIDPISNVTVTVGGSVSLTATVNGGCPPITLSKPDEPSWVTIGSRTDVSPTRRTWPITGTAPSTPGQHTVMLTAADTKRNTDTESFTITVTCPPRSLSSIADVAASRHEAISPIQVRVSGGCPPYTYRLSPNASTAGLSVSSSGQISGTPGAIGSWQITVSVTDARSNTSTTSFWIRVAEPIIIGPIADMYGEYLASFSDGPVEVFGGVPPYEYSLTGQPSGLRVTNTGVIEGTPSESGDFAVTLTVRDQQGRSESSLFFIIISTGDFNGDGRADATDSKLFNKKMGLRRSDTGYDRRMDMNGDGIINYADFIILTRHIERDASSQSGQ